MPRRFSVLLSLFLVCFFGVVFFTIRQSHATVTFEQGISVEVEVARTVQDQVRGLSGHAPLDDEHGMLFVWDQSEPRTFWMKGMTFPIDIVWINKGIIIGIEHNVPIPTSGDDPLPTYRSTDPVDTVLEVAGGFTDRHNIQIGQTLNVTP